MSQLHVFLLVLVLGISKAEELFWITWWIKTFSPFKSNNHLTPITWRTMCTQINVLNVKQMSEWLIKMVMGCCIDWALLRACFASMGCGGIGHCFSTSWRLQEVTKALLSTVNSKWLEVGVLGVLFFLFTNRLWIQLINPSYYSHLPCTSQIHLSILLCYHSRPSCHPLLSPSSSLFRVSLLPLLLPPMCCK